MDAAPHSREEQQLNPTSPAARSVLPAGILTRTERQLIMNKLTKGAVAAAAAIAPLLGGAGTFATWNASAAVANVGITAGNLSIAPGAVAGTWSDATGAVDLSAYRITPGDVLTFTQDFDVTATGHSLPATLTLTAGSIAPASSNAQDIALAAALGNTAVLTAAGLASDGNGGYIVPMGTTSVTVTVTITFPTAAGNASQNGQVSLSGMKVTLTQD
jgi:alternate signal-mediated exported protein